MTKFHTEEADMTEIEQHEQQLMAAFARILRAEEEMAAAKTRHQQVEEQHRQELRQLEDEMAAAWADVAGLMKETGEIEVLLPGDVTDYKIGYAATRESVKAEDPAAVPDQFCRFERKPMLKEIGEHLKGLRDAGLPFPNWGRLERSEPKLGWKAVKKTNLKRKESACQEP
jgi:hypothetical protein